MGTFPWRKLSFLFMCLWAGLIFYLSNQPYLPFQHVFAHQDKLMHFVAYATLGFLGMGSARVQASGGYRPAQAWQVCLLSGLYGITDELHQYFIPGRTADSLDAIADIAGGIIGVWSMYQLVRLTSKRLQTRHE